MALSVGTDVPRVKLSLVWKGLPQSFFVKVLFTALILLLTWILKLVFLIPCVIFAGLVLLARLKGGQTKIEWGYWSLIDFDSQTSLLKLRHSGQFLWGSKHYQFQFSEITGITFEMPAELPGKQMKVNC